MQNGKRRTYAPRAGLSTVQALLRSWLPWRLSRPKGFLGTVVRSPNASHQTHRPDRQLELILIGELSAEKIEVRPPLVQFNRFYQVLHRLAFTRTCKDLEKEVFPCEHAFSFKIERAWFPFSLSFYNANILDSNSPIQLAFLRRLKRQKKTCTNY